MRRFGLAVALLALAAVAAGAGSPPSDCPTATGVARLLCDDASLAALDRTLADVLPKARAAALPAERAALDEEQHAFRRRCDACLEREAPADCLAFAYTLRIAELRIAYGLVPAPRTETWECRDGTLVLVAFYGGPGEGGARPGAGGTRRAPRRDAPPAPAVALTRGDRKEVAVLRPAPRGVRYEADGAIVFSIVGEEADVRWAGKQTTCTRAGR